MALSRNAAEDFAVRVFGWLAEDPDRIGAFLAWSGESPARLRGRLDDPGLWLAILDFLLLDEAQLLAACADLGVAPETPLHARAALPGGDDIHWT